MYSTTVNILKIQFTIVTKKRYLKPYCDIEKVSKQKSKCVAVKRWLQGWSAILLLCAQGVSIFIFFAGRQINNLFYSTLFFICKQPCA